MPSTSEKQRRLMGIALSIKRGKTPASKSEEAAEMARTMSEKDLREFAHSIKRKNGKKKKKYSYVGR